MKKQLHILCLFAGIFCASTFFSQGKYQIKGMLLLADSTSPASFAYIINNNTHSGVIADLNGRFNISADETDSILVKFLGYENYVFKVSKLRNENDSTKAFKKIYLKQLSFQLSTVYVNSFKIKPGERAYMQRVINRPQVSGINVMESPLTALWQTFSKKGREMSKLQAIFEDVLRQEEIQKKVNTEMLRKLLDDESITFDKFRMYCPEITDEFILSTNGYDLYNAISTSYKNWKKLNVKTSGSSEK